jgi:pectinesterase
MFVASSRSGAGRSSNDATYYVINNSTISGTGPTYLGRPWSTILL